jgi:3-isopropylmalate dehydrogenase
VGAAHMGDAVTAALAEREAGSPRSTDAVGDALAARVAGG